MMGKRARTLRHVGWILAVLAPLGAVLLAAPSAEAGTTVTGGGSSWAALALEQWASDVSSQLNISYSTTSSVIGLNEFAQNQINFGVSEIGYSTGQADDVPPAGDAFQYLPAVGGADCLMYNVAGDAGPITGLRLDSTVLAGIFTGTITSWNDPAIAAINPGIALPNSAITAVYRTDPSGDNYVFSDYLETLQPGAWNAFAAKLGSPGGPQSIWPVPQGSGNYAPYNFSNWIGQSGSDDASQYVAANPNSITYVETGYAIEHNIPCANVENNSDAFVQPSELNDAIALSNDQLQADLEQNLTPVFNSPQASAYPISAYGYFITQEGQTDPSIGSVLGVFLKFVACQGQSQAGALGYTPLPLNLVQDDFAAIGRINGAPAPGLVNATNCPNPYATGAVAQVGQPQVAGQASTGSSGSGSSGGTVSVAAGAAKGGSATEAAANAAAAKAAKAAKAAEANAAALAANGQALASAVSGRQLGLGPAGPIFWWTLGLLLLLAIPTAILLVTRRRNGAGAPSGEAP